MLAKKTASRAARLAAINASYEKHLAEEAAELATNPELAKDRVLAAERLTKKMQSSMG